MQVTLHHGDCLDVMKSIPQGSVDMVLCDLPYGTTNCAWDSIIPLDKLWAEYKRVLKPFAPVLLFGSQPFTTTVILSNLQWYKYSFVWVKNRPTGFVHAKNKPMKKHEDICVFSGGTTVHKTQSSSRMPYYPQGLVTINETHERSEKETTDTCFSKRKSHGKFKREFTNYPHSVLEFSTDMLGKHPTQKPIALLEYLIRTYTTEGETILDNCMGSGSTGVASITAGRKFVGIEMDEKHFQTAEKWISEAKTQLGEVLFR